jgi:hypothetical protein
MVMQLSKNSRSFNTVKETLIGFDYGVCRYSHGFYRVHNLKCNQTSHVPWYRNKNRNCCSRIIYSPSFHNDT